MSRFERSLLKTQTDYLHIKLVAASRFVFGETVLQVRIYKKHRLLKFERRLELERMTVLTTDVYRDIYRYLPADLSFDEETGLIRLKLNSLEGISFAFDRFAAEKVPEVPIESRGNGSAHTF
jgi:hypothetical protein